MTHLKTYEWHYVKERLRLWDYEIHDILKLGIIAPVGRTPHGQPLFSPEAIEKLATKEERARIKDALWWFELLQHPKLIDARQDVFLQNPYYPFDSEDQRAWAHELFLNKRYGNLPTRHARRVQRRMKTIEDLATKAFEKSQRTNARFSLHRYRRELFNLVWSKTMIRAAADRKISEFTLRKRCREYLIPLPTRGHFNHKNPKDRPRKPALPPFRTVKPSPGEL
ncbi:MAG: hypothetical protein JWL86_316 [Rhizobium sp.]|nr:hypothetical protein [Rhizobium sp.]